MYVVFRVLQFNFLMSKSFKLCFKLGSNEKINFIDSKEGIQNDRFR